jgi:hypothetical protein
MKTQTLYKIISMYSDPTVPSEIISGTVSEIQALHDKGEILYNSEAIYDYMRGNVRKNGRIVSVMGVPTTYNPNGDFDAYYQNQDFISLIDNDNQE